MYNSIWEKNWFFNADTIIIGSGIVGLSTAAALIEENPNHQVLILERGLIPTGASTRNAGFACFGSATEIMADIDLMGKEASFNLVKMRYEGLQKLRKRVGDKALDFKGDGGYEIITEPMVSKLSRLQEVNKLLRPIFKEDIYHLVPEKIEEFGFNKEIVKAMVYNKYEGQIDSGKAMSHLLTYVQKLGAKIITGAEVIKYEKHTDGKVKVVLKNPLRDGEKCEFLGKNMVICTNAFSGSLVQNLNIYPARGQVVVTKPIPGLKLKGTFHYDDGYFYFRDFYGRILLGGGRNLDIEGETTTEQKTTKLITDKLKSIIKDVILPGTDFEIEHEWAGIMCFGHGTKSPIIAKLEENVFCAIRMSGMGVALSSEAAEKIKNMILHGKTGETRFDDSRSELRPRL